MSELLAIVYLLVFPGFLFLIGFSFFAEWYDRKLVARLQNRMGPPFRQPFADFVKLLSKEDIVTEGVSARFQAAVPVVAFAAVATAFLYLPVAGAASWFGFPGDLILVLYLLTLPTILMFLMGWTSGNLFAAVGSLRAVSQLFVYEVPFFLAALAPALILETWTVADVVAAQSAGRWSLILAPIGFVVALVALQAKLERAPFDIPDAETEIVAGPLTELTGRKLALWHLTKDMELVTGAALVVALYLGGPTVPGVAVAGILGGAIAFAIFFVKVLVVVLVLSVFKAAVGRLRIDQLVRWGWTILTPLALLQIAVVAVLKGVRWI